MSELLGLGFWFLEKLSMREKVRGRWYVSISYFVCEGRRGGRGRGDKGKLRRIIGPGVSALSLWQGISHQCARKRQRRK